MKTKNCQKILAMTAVIGLSLLASNALAQSAPIFNTAAQPAAASQAAPQWSYGVSEVMQLVRANIGEDVIINYIQNSHNAYGLDVNQILYLKQQGVSDRIISTMLNQPKPAAAAPTVATPAPPAPQPMTAAASTSRTYTSTATVAPTVTYVQTAPPTYIYSQPYSPAPAPVYSGWALPISLSFSWFWGSGGGSGWHGSGWHH
jgi:hypothetical protein